jgi:hypothetical protein
MSDKASLETLIAAVYEGRLTDRDNMECVTVRLSHEVWRKIQEEWYRQKREQV